MFGTLRSRFVALVGAIALAAGLGVTSIPAASATSAPSGLRIDQITNTTVRAQWNAVSGATEYQVTANGAYAGSSTTLVEVVDGLTACTTYAMQVKAKAGGVWSGLSAPVSVKTAGCTVTPPPTEPPPAGTGSAAANLGWGTPIAAGSDEFNYVGPPSSTKWNNYNTSGHHGNGRRLQSQSTVNGSELVQTGLSNGDTGYLSSKYRPGTMYGKWEVRMKVNNRDTEYHPVLLLWPDSGGNTTTEDEVDFAESTSDKSQVKFFLHYGSAGSTTQTSAAKTLDMTVYHNYAVDWSPSGVRGYIDGQLWFTDTTASHNPNQPMHQGIQLDWFPDGTTTTTSTMTVDWTRAYAP